MAYTTIDKSDDYFQTKLYTGNYSTNNITSLDFQPDLVWIKKRSATESHILTDVVRGTGGNLYSNSTSAEDTGVTTGVTSFNSDGFSLGANNGFNQNGATFVSWNWKASGSASNNTDGDITASVSANATAGFSIVKFNTNGQSGTMTCGHGLGAVPKMIILKPLPTTDNWYTYHVATGNAKYLQLNSTSVVTSNSNTWGSTSPTSSVFSMSTNFWGANTNDIIGFCFADVKGYSKFSSYVGNGNADGPFVYTGFKVAWLMVKATSVSSSYTVLDNKRNPFNPMGKGLFPDSTQAEYDYTNRRDYYSNGFKIRNTSTAENSSGVTYTFMAFASNPFVTSTGIPATAK